MDKLFLKIYQVFQDKAELFEAVGLEPIKHLDIFRGQTTNPEQFEYYDQPALFIDWRTTWEKGGKTYNGRLSLDFHLVTDPTWETSNISTNKEEGLKKLIYHALVRYLLDNLKSENTGAMERTEDTPVDTGVVNYHMFRYVCNYYDPVITGPEWVYELAEELKLTGYLANKDKLP